MRVITTATAGFARYGEMRGGIWGLRVAAHLLLVSRHCVTKGGCGVETSCAQLLDILVYLFNQWLTLQCGHEDAH